MYHNIKYINTSHVKDINLYIRTKLKLAICNANIQFNKTCIKHNITPQYAQIKIKTSNNSQAKKKALC
jgi:hypothetical protein